MCPGVPIQYILYLYGLPHYVNTHTKSHLDLLLKCFYSFLGLAPILLIHSAYHVSYTAILLSGCEPCYTIQSLWYMSSCVVPLPFCGHRSTMCHFTCSLIGVQIYLTAILLSGCEPYPTIQSFWYWVPMMYLCLPVDIDLQCATSMFTYQSADTPYTAILLSGCEPCYTRFSHSETECLWCTSAFLMTWIYNVPLQCSSIGVQIYMYVPLNGVGLLLEVLICCEASILYTFIYSFIKYILCCVFTRSQ